MVREMSLSLGGLIKKLAHGTVSTADFEDEGRKTLTAHIKAARAAGMSDAYDEMPKTPPPPAPSEHKHHPDFYPPIPPQGLYGTVVDVQGDAVAKKQSNYWVEKLLAVMKGGSLLKLNSAAALYGLVLGAQYESAFGVTVAAAHPEVKITWHTDGGEICDLCAPRDGVVYTMASLPGFPGDGGFGDLCEGAMNCKCTLTYHHALKGGEEQPVFENTGRTGSLQDYPAAQTALLGIRDSVMQARNSFLAGLPDTASARNFELEQTAIDIAQQQRQNNQLAVRPLTPQQQGGRGTWPADISPQQINAALGKAAELHKKGDAQALIDWYNDGADGAINWGEDGDFDDCVAIAGKYIDDPEGFCQLRHIDATGSPSGHAPGEVKKDATTPQSVVASEVLALESAMECAFQGDFESAVAYANAAVAMSDILKTMVVGDKLDARNQLDKLIDQITNAWNTGVNASPLINPVREAIDNIKRVIGCRVNDRVTATSKAYNPDEPRNSRGEWTSGGSSGGVSDDAVSAALAGLKEGGFTVRPDGTAPTTGFQVGGLRDDKTYDPSTVNSHDAMKAAMQDVYQSHQALFDNNKSVHIGGWVGPDGKLVMEPSENISDKNTAVQEGQRRNQVSVWDNQNTEEIPTGGTGSYVGDAEPTGKMRTVYGLITKEAAEGLDVGDVFTATDAIVTTARPRDPDGVVLVMRVPAFAVQKVGRRLSLNDDLQYAVAQKTDDTMRIAIV